MKHIKLYNSQVDGLDKIIETPAIFLQNDEKELVFAPTRLGDKIKVIKNTLKDTVIAVEKYVEEVIDDTTKFIGDHGGMLATFNFDGTNNVIGGYALYNKLLAVYLDGELYDIDDLIINVSGGSGSASGAASGSGSGSASGSASGSGSGSSMSVVAFPNTVTGEHEVEYILELDDDGTLDISGKGWFNNLSAMTSVTIPNFIDGMNYLTFYNSINITKLIIDSCILNNNYFDDTYGDGYTGNINIDFNGSKYSAGTLQTIIIGNSIKTIGNFAFHYCKLTSITIPNSVIGIGKNSFDACQISSITLPNSVTSIGDNAFRYCTKLTSITIPNSVTRIGKLAFDNVAKVIYNGSATGSPWGANEVVTSE